MKSQGVVNERSGLAYKIQPSQRVSFTAGFQNSNYNSFKAKHEASFFLGWPNKIEAFQWERHKQNMAPSKKIHFLSKIDTLNIYHYPKV